MNIDDEELFTTGEGLRIPRHMRQGLIDYIEGHRKPGDFLSAVLANDLRESVSRADSTNKIMLGTYISFLYCHAPSACWGSYSKVEDWLGALAAGEPNDRGGVHMSEQP